MFTVSGDSYIIWVMSHFENLRWTLIGWVGKIILWVWAKSARLTVVGEDEYRKLRQARTPVVILVWHSRIFLVPYFFRHRGIMPLVSPSQDGEIVARIMALWGYKILRGSSSHVIKDAWNAMVQELRAGGEVLIVPDGPKGPKRRMKLGGLRLAQETGACLVPFTFSTPRKILLNSWDRFLMFRPFARVVAVYGRPLPVNAGLRGDALENKRRELEDVLDTLDERADEFLRR